MPNFVSERGLIIKSVQGIAVWLALLTLLILQGCATHSAGFAKVEQEVALRNLPNALKAMDDLTKHNFTSADNALNHLNKGTLLRLKGDYAASNQEFDAAKRLMDELSAISVREQAASVLANDTVKAYEGDLNEQLLLYAFKALNYLQLGDFDAAAVEARQFDVKHRLVMEKEPNATYLSGAFVRYLNGLVYEAVGERDSARIEFDKAIEGYKAQQSLTGFNVPNALLADRAYFDKPRESTPSAPPVVIKQRGKNKKRLDEPITAPAVESVSTEVLSVEPEQGEVVFFLHNGLGPTLAETIIQLPNPSSQSGVSMLRVALPLFVARPVPVTYFSLAASTQEGGGVRSELAENINALAKKSLEERLPVISARAVARLAVKSLAVKEAKRQAQNNNNASFGMLMSLGADLAAIASERADTRSWSLLPGNIQLARLSLPPGTHDLKAFFYGNQGNLLSAREYKNVVVRKGRKVFLADYYVEALVPKVR